MAPTAAERKVLTMTEYIAREKVLSKAAPVAGCFSNMISAYDVIMLPAADVAPVRHGRWLYHTLIDGHIHAECSECHKIRIIDNFCPNCGAKMDEVSE